MIVSMKHSTLIHLFPRQLAPDSQPSLQLTDRLHGPGSLPFSTNVVREPQPKLSVQCRTLSRSSATRRFNQVLVRAQGNISDDRLLELSGSH